MADTTIQTLDQRIKDHIANTSNTSDKLENQLDKILDKLDNIKEEQTKNLITLKKLEANHETHLQVKNLP